MLMLTSLSIYQAYVVNSLSKDMFVTFVSVSGYEGVFHCLLF